MTKAGSNQSRLFYSLKKYPTAEAQRALRIFLIYYFSAVSASLAQPDQGGLCGKRI
jgi:hypothetical protein